MAYFKDSGYTRAFRDLFERLPPYTLHNMRASRENEMQRIESARQSGFAARTQTGASVKDRFTATPAVNGLAPRPESGVGRIVNSSA
ncbi:hypothetical protein [Desulfocurvus sp. DL9XJH121]